MEKINLQQLAKTLAAKKNMTQKDAEKFLGQFFDAIIDSVAVDKIVKIKGLGTFKLIEVLDRESVNVNTGERIIIPGHSKLSFTPDAAVKDQVNKPFADFQTVIINEGTNIEDMERIDPSEAQEETDDELELEQDVQSAEEDTMAEDEPAEDTEVTEAEEPTTPQETALAAEPEASPADEAEAPVASEAEVPAVSVAGDAAAQTSEPAPEPASEAAPEVEAEPEAEPILASEPVSAPAQPKVVVQVRALTFVETCALVLGAILLCVLSYWAGYHRLLCPSADTKEKPQIVMGNPTEPTAPADTTKEASPVDTTATAAPVAQQPEPLPETKPEPKPQPKPELKPEAKPQPKPEPKPEVKPQPKPEVKPEPKPQPQAPAKLNPNVAYKIVGTRRMHKMQTGDYLTRIAVQEYGHRHFAKYIIEYNQFPNPDNIPLGSEIKLPELKEIK